MMEAYVCPLCLNGVVEAFIVSDNGDHLVWSGCCDNHKCDASLPSEVIGPAGQHFPIEEWAEDYGYLA